MVNKIIKQAQEWLGKNEKDGSFKVIIDTYNAHKPLARGHKVKYTEPWCATFVSAVAIKCGATDVIPTECGCEKMINLFKGLGAWVENEAKTDVKAGDIIFYDWGDSGIGDNKGYADHVGIVEKVASGKITVIEGNYSESVKRRVIEINSRYIRGYAVPKYKTETVKKESDEVTINEIIKAMEDKGFKVETNNANKLSFVKATDKSKLKDGDVITLKAGAKYWNGVAIPSWVYKKTLYYRGTNKNGIVFSILKTGATTGTVKAEYVN